LAGQNTKKNPETTGVWPEGGVFYLSTSSLILSYINLKYAPYDQTVGIISLNASDIMYFHFKFLLNGEYFVAT
jgi:hypothetical protein